MIMAGLFSTEIYDRTHYKGLKFKMSVTMITNTSGPVIHQSFKIPYTTMWFVCVYMFLGGGVVLSFLRYLWAKIRPKRFE